MNKITKQILDKVPKNAKVLDLGCGDGSLLSTLIKEKNCSGYGIDLNHDCIIDCTKKGISAFQSDMESGLDGFSDQFFDVVILSQTLQQVNKPLDLIKNMLRISKQAIVTFPNFAHWTIRFSLLFGDIPKSKALPYEWYDTPNIRVISIQSFREMCKKNKINIVEELSIYERGILNFCLAPLAPNFFCHRGMFLIEKK
ncbi:methionine biosynthesis protein MetW [Candidatus Marinamargulisbacteria bacterium SCGC AAA071-K20]|nr:methionine biosynthesis protein MetW [Candidatus Marinamargulisbacteria bacterium SCGC AAA071-K20]